MVARHIIGETTLRGKNQISLPAEGVRELRWEKGDRLRVEVLGDDMMILMRRPENWTQTFAGRLGHVFGTHEQSIQWLDDERRSCDEHERPRVRP